MLCFMWMRVLRFSIHPPTHLFRNPWPISRRAGFIHNTCRRTLLITNSRSETALKKAKITSGPMIVDCRIKNNKTIDWTKPITPAHPRTTCFFAESAAVSIQTSFRTSAHCIAESVVHSAWFEVSVNKAQSVRSLRVNTDINIGPYLIKSLRSSGSIEYGFGFMHKL